MMVDFSVVCCKDAKETDVYFEKMTLLVSSFTVINIFIL